ncbi:acid sphingomyelinase-like phosphodiesterase 3b [Gracilinanus agilis]|uniref:acid sphingomyelinase-like phosphodiesterase 3b n=1 Tax=Gracilinanus agilis TaxID=191870 RepID=UPI001CFDD781|nr:acid sphingomyelinase-like phosphodiesterase 3b [Gracilinanus agilis]
MLAGRARTLVPREECEVFAAMGKELDFWCKKPNSEEHPWKATNEHESISPVPGDDVTVPSKNFFLDSDEETESRLLGQSQGLKSRSSDSEANPPVSKSQARPIWSSKGTKDDVQENALNEEQLGGPVDREPDLHLELEYNHMSEDPSQVCPSSGSQLVSNAGVWGDYLCDAPWMLINSSIFAMKAILPKPDFILLTGDFTAQILNEEWTEEAVLIIVKRLTDLLLLVFPETTVYATLGNDDFHPKDQLPAKSNVIYSYIADLWRPWLDYKSISQFKKGAFYHQNLPGKKSAGQVLALNTNLYYEKNGAESRMHDPGKQFKWMDTVLSEAFQDGKKVFIIGHMPPGFFEKTQNKAWFRPNFNKRYMEIIKKHHHVIAGQFFGHHHTDSFRMFYDDTDKPVSVMFLTPGMTPRKRTIPEIENGANNPGIRVWDYDRDTLQLQWILVFGEIETCKLIPASSSCVSCTIVNLTGKGLKVSPSASQVSSDRRGNRDVARWCRDLPVQVAQVQKV